MMDSNEQMLDKISIDVYNKKVIARGNDGSMLAFKCSSINELIDLMNECKRLLRTEHVTVR